MRHKTLFSLIVLCGSSAALAHMPASIQTDPSLQNEMVNEGVPAPDDTSPPDTMSNSTDVEPSAEPMEPAEPTEPAPDPTDNGTDTAPEPMR